MLHETVVCFDNCGNSIQGRLEAAERTLGLVVVRFRAMVKDVLEMVPLGIHEPICWEVLEDRGILRSSKASGNRHTLERSHMVLPRLDGMRRNVWKGLNVIKRSRVANVRRSRLGLLRNALRFLIRSNTGHLLDRGERCLGSRGSPMPFELRSSVTSLLRVSIPNIVGKKVSNSRFGCPRCGGQSSGAAFQVQQLRPQAAK